MTGRSRPTAWGSGLKTIDILISIGFGRGDGFQTPDSRFPDRHGFWGRNRETRKPTRMAHSRGIRSRPARRASRHRTPSPAGRAGRGRGADGRGRGLGLATELLHRPDEPAGVAETTDEGAV